MQNPLNLPSSEIIQTYVLQDRAGVGDPQLLLRRGDRPVLGGDQLRAAGAGEPVRQAPGADQPLVGRMAGTLQPSTGGSSIRERPSSAASRRRPPPILTLLSRLGGKPPIRQSRGDRVFNGFNRLFLWSWLVVVLYPLVYVLSSSFSSPVAVITGRVWAAAGRGRCWTATRPCSRARWCGPATTTASSTQYSVLPSTWWSPSWPPIPLARRDFVGRNAIMFLFTFTLFFSGRADSHVPAGAQPGAGQHPLGDAAAERPRRVARDHHPHLLPEHPAAGAAGVGPARTAAATCASSGRSYCPCRRRSWR